MSRLPQTRGELLQSLSAETALFRAYVKTPRGWDVLNYADDVEISSAESSDHGWLEKLCQNYFESTGQRAIIVDMSSRNYITFETT